MKTNRTGSVVAFIASGILIVLAVLLFVNRQHILDQLSVWSYTPSSSVQAIEEKVGFTEKGTFIFYATHPTVDTSTNFNSSCPRQETMSPILGCYVNDRVYIFNITNSQLDGMEEVTAAHEMLHAVWARMGVDERQKLGSELESAYKKINDSDLKSRMEYYERTEPGEFTNELHSILGTEIASLGEPLESYYRQYFNRQTVLSLHAQYNTVYKDLNKQVDDLFNKMESLSASIEQSSGQYDAQSKQLADDINTFNTRANNGGFASQSQFNQERSRLEARSANLETQRQVINANIEQYNLYYTQYEAIAKQIEVLNNSIDSFKQIEAAPAV
ncbi:MAG: hypothetical protein WAR37_00310 [Candidatus Microsaccharimonas sp.]